MSKLQFQFDANLDYQRHAIDSVVNLFEGFELMHGNAHGMEAGKDVISNMDSFDSFDLFWLGDNLRTVQMENNREERGSPLDVLAGTEPEIDSGVMLEGVSNDSHEAPHFTIEMETGTGKTYVYLRTIRELYKRYGWRKFVIVVPSVAISEGVKKSFAITRGHLDAIYGADQVTLADYDGAQPGRLRDFASSQFLSILLITIQAFNSKGNNLYKATDKLAGERLPYQFIQETRPIIILDEPQNMESAKAQEAIRTLTPLFVLRYSATHRSSPNTVYRLTPLDAFRQNLVKQIQVIGISDLNLETSHVMRLEEVARAKGKKPTAKLRTIIFKGGEAIETELILKGGDDLFSKTGNPAHQGIKVENIIKGKGKEPDRIVFSDGSELSHDDALSNRESVFRAQIEKTIEEHMAHQKRLEPYGIKVLSLFFIDRVANYIDPDGLIKRLFDESFEKLKQQHEGFAKYQASEVRDGYFSKMVNSKTGEETYFEDMNNQKEREAAKETFELIMRDKERLLSFDEPVSFIFAHSALKEGWDNPNVFQICTLNHTLSPLKKRQEIGRGLRLCVDSSGQRPDNQNFNILTVVANESYEHYVNALQSEYAEEGKDTDSLPPVPKPAKRAQVRRRNEHYESESFRSFWGKLCQQLSYRIVIDSDNLAMLCIDALNRAEFPKPMLTIERGYFGLMEYNLEICAERLYHEKARLKLTFRHNIGENLFGDMEQERIADVGEGEELRRAYNLKQSQHYQNLRGFKVIEVSMEQGQPRVLLETPEGNVELSLGYQHRFITKQVRSSRIVEERASTETYPVEDFISKTADATGLTRKTVLSIFTRMHADGKATLLHNPQGWAKVFSSVVQGVVADFIAKHLDFEPARQLSLDAEELFPELISQPQKELVQGNPKALYDQVQIDSEVERQFVENILGEDVENIVFFFKFPPKFKISLPKIIGNYNPDWGIVRDYRNGEVKRLELIRETKGSEDENALQYAHERRKIWAAKRYFEALQSEGIPIDYRVVTHKTVEYWKRSRLK